MPLFRTSTAIEQQIDEFLDRIAEGALVYRAGVESYLSGDREDFTTRLAAIDRLESEADTLSKSVEAQLYSHSLIPDHRGDVLGLLENTDNVIDTAKSSLHQFAIELPVIPEEFREGFRRLAAASAQAAEAVAIAARTFFRDPAGVKDHLFKVHHWEKDADKLSDSLKRAVFASDLELAHKTQLRYFAHTVEQVSDEAEEVADRLAIYAIKRNL
jgi:predicted phosphate transport protein (TIGR00153 family)